ncbi:tyrosine-protein phosphatase YwqE [Larkinella arboricola]|uniref:protein-tyrosine-phosphatase n=1 Tax=Larkinella arboricola TaxID=643671 RepID=A0A327X7L5_LARAB|nr:CpsB/CapC family capsule biosynthesis tyrosine phosphatase [Larkinella arboricola]RAK03130.1 tyrosine-protein phosphatase YwqE [Larkinella arboricola]
MPFNFFLRAFAKPNKPASATLIPELYVDVHAQLLPGRQDGTDSVEHSMSLLRELSALGYRKVVATLHIMNGFYHNTIESISASSALLTHELQKSKIDIEVEVAAEYFVDINLLKILYTNADLLTFGKNNARYLLLDTSLVKRPYELDKVITALQQRNIIPVMAHPEQYIYLQKDPEAVQGLHEQGVKFQMNLLSLTGQPSRESRHLAEWMIDHRLVSFVGTDICHETQLPAIKEARKLPHFHKLLESGLLVNNSLV